jgi:hypothetical protein
MDEVAPEVHREEVEACTDISPENIPLPTSSMITVRLSDIQVHPDVGEDLEPGVSQVASLRQSIPSSTRSSRSSSQISDSSASIHSVDWEGLEKTEEQEAKDEETDEVRSISCDGKDSVADVTSLLLFCSPV